MSFKIKIMLSCIFMGLSSYSFASSVYNPMCFQKKLPPIVFNFATTPIQNIFADAGRVRSEASFGDTRNLLGYYQRNLNWTVAPVFTYTNYSFNENDPRVCAILKEVQIRADFTPKIWFTAELQNKTSCLLKEIKLHEEKHYGYEILSLNEIKKNMPTIVYPILSPAYLISSEKEITTQSDVIKNSIQEKIVNNFYNYITPLHNRLDDGDDYARVLKKCDVEAKAVGLQMKRFGDAEVFVRN